MQQQPPERLGPSISASAAPQVPRAQEKYRPVAATLRGTTTSLPESTSFLYRRAVLGRRGGGKPGPPFQKCSPTRVPGISPSEDLQGAASPDHGDRYAELSGRREGLRHRDTGSPGSLRARLRHGIANRVQRG